MLNAGSGFQPERAGLVNSPGVAGDGFVGQLQHDVLIHRDVQLPPLLVEGGEADGVPLPDERALDALAPR